MAGDLFVRARPDDTLESFANRMGKLMAIGGLERRESGSYVDGEYYKGMALAVIVKLARTDEVDLKDYDYWIHFQTSEVWIENPAFVDGLADLLARCLTLAGEQVVRMPNAERANGRKILYRVNESAPHGSQERITVTHE